jgi:hypothetical protein
LGGRIGDRNGYLLTAASGLVLASGALWALPVILDVSALISVSIVFGMAQALILPSCVALFANQIDYRHTGSGTGFFWFDEKPWKDLRTDSRRVARASSSDFLDALVAFRTFDSVFTLHVLFLDGAQRNSSDYGLNFFEPKISEISLLNFFFFHIT